MRCTKVEATFAAGIGIVLVGAACLIAVEVSNVSRAREEQTFKEINCTIASGNMDAKEKCSDNKQDDTKYPCLRIYVLCGNSALSNGLFRSEKPRLLSKDYYSLEKQCTFEPEQCTDKTEAKPKLLQSFQSQGGNPIGTPLQCYYNPKDPDQIVRQRASKDSYNKLVLNNMAWPIGIVVVGLAVVVMAGCFVSSMRRRNGYEKIDENSIKPLQQTL